MTSSPEIKQPKIPPDDGTFITDSKNETYPATLTIAQLLESLKNFSTQSKNGDNKLESEVRKTSDSEKSPISMSPQQHQQLYREEIDHLRHSNYQFKQEIERKDIFIQELLKKLHESQTLVSELQGKFNSSKITSENKSTPVSPLSSPLSVPASIALEPSNFPYLKVIQQPPSHAVYQRILKPFPTVVVMGVNHIKNCHNLFVEVTLVKQEDQDSDSNSVTCKGGGSPLEGEKKNLIGGQLVQRSTETQTPDSLLVVFKKLKVLTTNSQQGTDFFLLKFTLKRYVDNIFETIPNISPVYSDPFEVFSHTLYLKDKGTKAPKNPVQGTKRKMTSEAITKQDVAKILASASTSLLTGSNQRDIPSFPASRPPVETLETLS